MTGPPTRGQILGQRLAIWRGNDKKGHGDAKSLCQAINDQDCGVAAAAFDFAQVIQSDIGFEGERFLRHVPAEPQASHIETDLPQNIHDQRQVGCEPLFYELLIIEL